MLHFQKSQLVLQQYTGNFVIIIEEQNLAEEDKDHTERETENFDD